jgi:hypothetical protein
MLPLIAILSIVFAQRDSFVAAVASGSSTAFEHVYVDAKGIKFDRVAGLTLSEGEILRQVLSTENGFGVITQTLEGYRSMCHLRLFLNSCPSQCIKRIDSAEFEMGRISQSSIGVRVSDSVNVRTLSAPGMTVRFASKWGNWLELFPSFRARYQLLKRVLREKRLSIGITPINPLVMLPVGQGMFAAFSNDGKCLAIDVAEKTLWHLILLSGPNFDRVLKLPYVNASPLVFFGSHYLATSVGEKARDYCVIDLHTGKIVGEFSCKAFG